MITHDFRCSDGEVSIGFEHPVREPVACNKEEKCWKKYGFAPEMVGHTTFGGEDCIKYRLARCPDYNWDTDNNNEKAWRRKFKRSMNCTESAKYWNVELLNCHFYREYVVAYIKFEKMTEWIQ